MESHRWRADAGIAVGPILFIIAILGLLASAIAAGSGSFTASTSTQEAKAQAQAIIQYADLVKFAVDLVRGSGCTDEQISFENNIVSGYTNSNAPADHSCHVFDPLGGGVNLQKPPSQINQQYVFNGYNDTRGVADTPSGSEVSETFDLIMFLPFVPLGVCQQLNQEIFGSTQIPTTACIHAAAKFTGNYVWSCHYIINGGTVNGINYASTTVPAPMSGCVYATGAWLSSPPTLTGNYFFYRVLAHR
jgi:type II secretory pathway pseudopilin PulG